MDRALNSIAIGLDGDKPIEARTLVLLAAGKGLDIRRTILADETAIMYSNAQFEGVWPCIEFLSDIFPFPGFYPEEPRKRAVIRTLTNALFTRDMTPMEMLDVFDKQKFNVAPSLLHFAAIAQTSVYEPTLLNRGWGKDLCVQMDEYIKRMASGTVRNCRLGLNELARGS